MRVNITCIFGYPTVIIESYRRALAGPRDKWRTQCIPTQSGLVKVSESNSRDTTSCQTRRVFQLIFLLQRCVARRRWLFQRTLKWSFKTTPIDWINLFDSWLSGRRSCIYMLQRTSLTCGQSLSTWAG